MACTVAVIAKSRNPKGVVLTTVQLKYWRAIHAELMTHRVFSRNASSSRAVPVKTMLKQVWNDPAGPIHWGANQAGMQAHSELAGAKLKAAKLLWKLAGRMMCLVAWSMMKVGLHKQVANRLLEPWQYIHVVVTATDWTNFFELRDHQDAQPEIKELARSMQLAMNAEPARQLKRGEWHLPYSEWPVLVRTKDSPKTLLEAIKFSVARCARTSYITHGDTFVNTHKDLALHDRLVDSEPLHASPTEHQAQANDSRKRVKNFLGFTQYRKFLEDGSSVYSNLPIRKAAEVA